MARTVRKRINTAKARVVLLGALLSGSQALSAQESADTTLRHHRLRPLEVMGVKQTPTGTLTTEAVTIISGAESRRLGIDAVKGVSIIAPNFFMPDYGSRMTSSIYVRGLGARMDQPVVGLSVDNIPYLNKDSYDFDLADIENIEVLRGAQSVLNGRNTMGGQINIRTLSPLRAQGFRAMAEYGSGNTFAASASYYGKIAPDAGMSLSAQYRHTDGFFRNAYNGKRLDTENSGSIRWKSAWHPSERLSLNNTAVLNLNKQGGYPYALLPDKHIAYNDTCSYRRTSFADGLTVAWAGNRVVVTSVTSFQYLDDSMRLDQDFTPADYFTLTQNRREWTLTEDLFTRGARGSYSWLGGVFAFYKDTDMDAPVTFKDTGITELIEKHRNDVNPDYPIAWDSRTFTLGSNFTLRSGGFALYHESEYTLGGWKFEAGLRLDIEKAMLDYRSKTNTGYTTWHVLPDGEREIYSHTPIDINDHGKLSQTFVELLPKVAVSYDFGFIRPYFSFSKGYKAGGYNTQMFSDVLQQRIQAFMGMSSLYRLADIVSYEPERSFNYELGFHAQPLESGELSIDGALFFIDCRNQQLTRFPAGNTTGRMMTNAGRTRSMGAEISTTWQPASDIRITASYGHTDATFRRYNDGRAEYRGKHLPYAPLNTLFGEIHYRATPLTFAGITPSVQASVRCAGDIWWNEANTSRQKFYCLPGFTIGLDAEKWSLRLWSTNLTNTHYDVFYFLSMSREFVQKGLPRRLGLTLRLNLGK